MLLIFVIGIHGSLFIAPFNSLQHDVNVPIEVNTYGFATVNHVSVQ